MYIIGAATTAPFSTIARSLIACMPRIALCGGLTIGVDSSEPKVPPLVMVKARDGKIGLDDLQGGTFTITNGGTFGSLMSTPIVNPPQSAILGMHAIKERPIAENGQVVVAPMMYIALSYDHRIIDGKDAVLFLADIKNQLENPHRMLLGM